MLQVMDVCSDEYVFLRLQAMGRHFCSLAIHCKGAISGPNGLSLLLCCFRSLKQVRAQTYHSPHRIGGLGVWRIMVHGCHLQ